MAQRTIVKVVAVSPGDVAEERAAIARVIDETNRTLAPSLSVSLQLWRWETDAHPGFHADGPQGLIDQLMDITESDLVIGVFWKRFGTPAMDARSGTEHELTRAWEACRENGSPQVMVYFNQAPAKPISSEDTGQWGRVLEFRERFPKEGLSWTYEGTDQFERLFREHFHRFLLCRCTPLHGGEPPSAADFECPRFPDAVTRRALLDKLSTAVREQPVVTIGGLSGSGKTYLLSTYVAEQSAHVPPRQVLWYDPVSGESLDSLFAHLSLKLPLPGLSSVSRCKELVAFLRDANGLLIIDNYHTVDHTTYSLLLEHCIRSGPPCHLVLLSQSYVDLLSASRGPYHVPVPGFTLNEAKHFLTGRELDGLQEELARELVEKTGGLPFAINLFAVLVAEFNRDPRELLSGAMTSTVRIRRWFDSITALVSPGAGALLPYLSLSDGPFSMGIVRLLSDHAGLRGPELAFEELQRHYLVAHYSPYRWKIHELVGHLSAAALDADRQNAAHSVLGHYFLRGLPRGKRAPLTPQEFVWKVRSFRHLFRSSTDVRLAEEVLLELAHSAKAGGKYELLLELSSEVLRDRVERSRWVDYDHAHCAFITGRVAYGMRLVQPLLYDANVASDDSLHLALVRLYAEMLATVGEERAGIALLGPLVEEAKPDVVGAVLHAQSKTALVWLLTRTGELADAARMADEVLGDAHKRGDKRGVAVAMARKGAIAMRRRLTDEATALFNGSLGLFRECGDRRGQAWSLTNLAECEFLLAGEAAAVEKWRAAAEIASDIGECGIDYRESLSRMEAEARLDELRQVIDRELRRTERAAGNSSVGLPSAFGG